jgi:aminoglycoside phosphotransferase (APT) family kinase protein
MSLLDQPTQTRPGEELDVAQLRAYLLATFPDLSGELTVQQFPAGHSNLTYFLQLGGREFVLRRPPFGANVKSAHDMAREHRILTTLRPVYPKVPQPLAYCPDESVIGAEFYLMERVQGLILRQRPPKELALTPERMRTIALATVDNLAALHQIDVQATQLVQIGKPEGYVQRQVEGWIGRYRRAETEVVPGMDQAAEWLPANLPTEQPPALLHNDYKYDNLVFNPDNLAEVVAVLDWEMATVGDPLMDLGTALGYWAESDSPEVLKTFSLTALPGNLSRQQVLERYAAQTGHQVGQAVFYYVFGCLKIGVICQQIYARYVKGFTKDPRFANMIYLVQAFGHSAAQAIGYGRISDFR